MRERERLAHSTNPFWYALYGHDLRIWILLFLQYTANAPSNSEPQPVMIEFGIFMLQQYLSNEFFEFIVTVWLDLFGIG